MELNSNTQKDGIKKGNSLKCTKVWKDGKTETELHTVTAVRKAKNGTRIHTSFGCSDISFEFTPTPHSFLVSVKWELV